MLEISHLRDNRDAVVASLAKRSKPIYEALVDEAIAHDKSRRTIQAQLDNLLAEQNLAAKEIGQLMQKGDASQAEKIDHH